MQRGSLLPHLCSAAFKTLSLRSIDRNLRLRKVFRRIQLEKEHALRQFLVIVGLIVLLSVSGFAQDFDAAFGVGTLIAPSASSASGNHSPVSLTGGAYPVFSADYLLKHNFGFGGEIAWRASRNVYAGFQPYRPLLYDFGAVYAPHTRKVGAELQAGIGWESLRFYQPFFNCGGFSGCSNFVSSNHFMGHFGGGLRYYFKGHFFVRPEAHVYLVRNNIEFSSPLATRVGVSLGYTFAPGF